MSLLINNPNSYPIKQTLTTHPIITPTHLQNTPKQKLTISQLKTYFHHISKFPQYTKHTLSSTPSTSQITLNPNFPLFIKNPYSKTPYSQLHSFNLNNNNFSIYYQIPNHKNHPFNHFINYNQTSTYSFFNPYFYNLKTNLFKTIKIKIPYLN